MSKTRENYTMCGLRIVSFLDSVYYYDDFGYEDSYEYYTVVVIPEGLHVGKKAILSYAATDCMSCDIERYLYQEREIGGVGGIV